MTKWITTRSSKITDLNKKKRVTRIVSGCVWASAPILLQQTLQKPDLIYERVLSKTAITNQSLSLNPHIPMQV